MAMQFTKATKRQARGRVSLIGPSGSGKTYTALSIAKHLGGRVALIDTERGSASKYANLFDFDTLILDSFHPERYIEAILAAEQAGYDILVIDSLSHAWSGKDGALELVDRAAKRDRSGNSFSAWREVTPLHNKLVDAMLACRCHLIATMRSKTEYVQEKDDRGKTVIRKVGLAPIQRDGLEYEFDVVADLDIDNNLIVSKTRCPDLHGAVIPKAGQEIAETLRAWLTDGAPVPPAISPLPTSVLMQAASAALHQAEKPKVAAGGNGHANGGDIDAALKAYFASCSGQGLRTSEDQKDLLKLSWRFSPKNPDSSKTVESCKEIRPDFVRLMAGVVKGKAMEDLLASLAGLRAQAEAQDENWQYDPVPGSEQAQPAQAEQAASA